MLIYSCSGDQSTKPETISHEIGIAYKNLRTGETFTYNAETMFHAASTMKTPVMFHLYRMRDWGNINLDAQIPVINQFTSIVDGSSFSLPIESENDEILYEALGQKMSYRDLIEKMITHSSNLATNILLEYTKADSIRQTLADLGAQGVSVLRGVEDLKAYHLGMNNRTNALGMMTLMEAVYKSELVADSSRQEMIEILKRQTYNKMIPAGLPRDVVVAHKTGSITRIAHDAALVFPPDSDPFVLVILTRGWENHAEAREAGATITSQIYDFHLGKLNRTEITVAAVLE